MPETFYLIDGHAQIFRAYYAIRGGMRSPRTGESTHAVYGVTAMLLKLFREFRPEYVAMAVDMPGKTFRDDLFEDYKGTREKTPDDLITQIPRVLEVTRLLGIPVVGVLGLEADDVIATITNRLTGSPSCSELQIRIISRDKDLEQLICDRVCLYDISSDILIDEAALLAKKGIHPTQVVDVLALTGDTSDNVPGVPGIGPKTATQLIQEFGSISGIYANIEKVKGKKREYLENARDTIGLSQKLVTLVRDADFPFSLEAARATPPDLERLLPVFEDLGFTRFQDEIRELARTLPGEKAPLVLTETGKPVQLELAGTGDYRAITTIEELIQLAATLRNQPLFAVDTETTGLERDARLCGISFSWKPGQGVYVPMLCPPGSPQLDEDVVMKELGPVLSDPSVPKCGHNLKFDAGMLLSAGVHLRGVVFDSFLASLLLSPSEPAHKLDYLSRKRLGREMIPITALIGEGAGHITVDQAPLDKVVPYAAEDADIALQLAERMLPEIQQAGMENLMRQVEAPLTAVIAEMERNGILCDPQELKRQGSELAVRVNELRRIIFETAGFEFAVDSPMQLGVALYDRLKFTPGKKTQTGYSTDIQELERLAAMEDRNDPRTGIPRLLIEYRQLTKLISTYLGNLVASIDSRDGRIHSTFHQIYTATGRLASQGPNLQNIPVRTEVGRQIRKAFPAAPGCSLICADYSQIELRILAHLSQDAGLINAFKQHQDIHSAVAAQVFDVPLSEVSREQRNRAKTINFGIIYGISSFGLSRRIEGLDVEGAARLINDYKERFPGIELFLRQCVSQAMDQGYVCTVMGRRRSIPELQSHNGRTRSLGERLAINSVVQGSAADLIKLAMVRVQERIDRDNLPLKILLQIHDELVMETPSEAAPNHAALVCSEMENALHLSIPLECSAGIGPDWLAAK